MRGAGLLRGTYAGRSPDSPGTTTCKPDVVVLNVTMPLVNGFEAAREIKRQIPETAIVILSSHADKYFVEEARKIGVRAYVPKSRIGQALVGALEAAVSGEDFIVLE
jgi:DNA-binding NarL/FixJ family response regulator